MPYRPARIKRRDWSGRRDPGKDGAMTNALAIWIFALILAAVAADWYFFDGATLLYIARRGLDLIQWLAFWR